MRIVAGLVQGPFTGETPFKTASVRMLSFLHPDFSWFCIETEETIPGFPDVIKVPRGHALGSFSRFFEFKCSNEYGVIKFKKSQPLFYRQNYLQHVIDILAWDKRYSRVVMISAAEVLERKSLTFRLPDDAPIAITAKML